MLPEVGLGRVVWILRSNKDECLGADGWVVHPDGNTDCVVVKQIYTCDKISKSYTHKTKEKKKRVHLTAVEICKKSVCGKSSIPMSESWFWPRTVFI